jgi:hypothetical protein
VRALTSVVIPECLYPLLDLISLLIVFLQLLLPLGLLLHVLHLLLLKGAPELVSVLLDFPFVQLLLSPDVVAPLFVLLRALDAEVLLPLILIQLVVMDLDTLCLVLVLITLCDRPHLSLRNGIFLGLNHFLKGLNTRVSQLHSGCVVVLACANTVHQVNVSVGCTGFSTLRSQHDVGSKSLLVGSR